MQEIKYRKNRKPLIFGCIALVMVICIYFIYLKDHKADEIKRTDETVKLLKAHECFTLPSNINSRRKFTEVTFQCFKQNSQVVLMIDSDKAEHFTKQFDLNNLSVPANERTERILLVSAPEIYNQQCEQGQQKPYCELSKGKPKIFYTYI